MECNTMKGRRVQSVLGLLVLAVGCSPAGCPTPAEVPSGGVAVGESDTAPVQQAATVSTGAAPTEAGELASDAPTASGAAFAEGVVGEEVTYSAGVTTLKGYIAYNAKQVGPRPGILVVHEWWGHNEYARQRARQLAALGYSALAVDMYGNGKQAAHPTEAKAFSSAVFSNLEQAEQRFTAALEVLKAHSSTQPDQISAIGYCFGGGIVLNMARRGVELDGVASFHGSLSAPAAAQPGAVKAKVLVLTGEKDPMVPPEQVAAFQQEMRVAGVEVELHSYPGAVHAFTNPGATELGKTYGMPLAYDAKADTESWQELTDFLAQLYPTAQ